MTIEIRNTTVWYGTGLEFATANPVLPNGQLAYVTDDAHYRMGDGSTVWAFLPIISVNLTRQYEGEAKPTFTPFTGLNPFTRDRGRKNLAVVEPTGEAYELQTSMMGNRVDRARAINDTATYSLDGLGITTLPATPSAVQNTATTGLYQQMVRVRHTAAATAGTGVGLRTNKAQWYLGNVANQGGFYFGARFGLAVVTATHRGFIGLSTTTAALSPTVNPSTFLSMVGFGWDSAHTTLRFMSNDATGTATMVDLGANFPVNLVTTAYYDVRMFAPSGQQAVRWNVTRLDTGATYSGSTTTDLPAVNTNMAAHMHASNGTTAAALSLDISSLYIETDN